MQVDSASCILSPHNKTYHHKRHSLTESKSNEPDSLEPTRSLNKVSAFYVVKDHILGSTLTFTTMVFDNERVCFCLLNTYAFTTACNSFDSKTEPAAANPAGVISELEVPKATLSFLQSDKELSCQERPLSVTLVNSLHLQLQSHHPKQQSQAWHWPLAP